MTKMARKSMAIMSKFEKNYMVNGDASPPKVTYFVFPFHQYSAVAWDCKN